MPSYSTGAAGVPPSRKSPGVFTQVVLGQGPSSSGGGPLRVLILANKTSGGSATVDTTIYDNLTPDQAISLGGTGSEFAIAVAAACGSEPGASVSGICVTEATGVQATGTITFTGSATGSGNCTVVIHGVQIVFGITSGDAVATIAANCSAAINAKGGLLMVTSAPSAGVVTLTARHKGTRGNLITCIATLETAVTGTTVAVSGSGKLASGTGTDTLTAALATAGVRRWDYVVPANVDTTAIQAVQAFLNSQMSPLIRKRGQGICCITDAVAPTTLSTAVNDALMQIVWHKNGEDPPVQISAAWAAIRSVAESINPNVHLSVMDSTLVDLWPFANAPTSSANYLTDTDEASALDNGITPLKILSNKHPAVSMSITSHFKDAFGGADTRVLTTNMVSVPFAWADRVEALVLSNFPGKYLVDDPPNGSNDLLSLAPNTVTPKIVRSILSSEFTSMTGFGQYLTMAAEDVATWAFNVDSVNQNRLDATMQLHPARWFTQFSAQVRQL